MGRSDSRSQSPTQWDPEDSRTLQSTTNWQQGNGFQRRSHGIKRFAELPESGSTPAASTTSPEKVGLSRGQSPTAPGRERIQGVAAPGVDTPWSSGRGSCLACGHGRGCLRCAHRVPPAPGARVTPVPARRAASRDLQADVRRAVPTENSVRLEAEWPSDRQSAFVRSDRT